MTDSVGHRGNRYRDRNQWRTTIRKQVLAKTGGVCASCGNPGTDGRGKGLQLAHIIPHDLGGPDTAANLAPLCATCHRQFDRGPRRQRPSR